MSLRGALLQSFSTQERFTSDSIWPVPAGQAHWGRITLTYPKQPFDAVLSFGKGQRNS